VCPLSRYKREKSQGLDCPATWRGGHFSKQCTNDCVNNEQVLARGCRHCKLPHVFSGMSSLPSILSRMNYFFTFHFCSNCINRRRPRTFPLAMSPHLHHHNHQPKRKTKEPVHTSKRLLCYSHTKREKQNLNRKKVFDFCPLFINF